MNHPTSPYDDLVIQKPPEITSTAKARKESPLAQFSDKIGKVQIYQKDVKSTSTTTTTSSHGFLCSTCKASFTSSDAYLDHCNGRVHQRNLGLSVKVERVNEVERVKSRLEMLTKKRYAAEEVIDSNSTDHFERQLQEAEESELKLKEYRKNRRNEKKKKTKLTETESTEDHVDSVDSVVDDDFMKTMGFKSFS